MQQRFIQHKIVYEREFLVKDKGNIIDFVVEDKIIIEVKAKPIILTEDYYQVQRYLQSLNKKLGLLINYRCQYLNPKRIVKIETNAQKKYI